MAHGFEEVCDGTRSGTRGLQHTRLALVCVVRTEDSRRGNGPHQVASLAVSRSFGTSEERSRAQGGHAVRPTKVSFSSRLIFKFSDVKALSAKLLADRSLSWEAKDRIDPSLRNP